MIPLMKQWSDHHKWHDFLTNLEKRANTDKRYFYAIELLTFTGLLIGFLATIITVALLFIKAANHVPQLTEIVESIPHPVRYISYVITLFIAGMSVWANKKALIRYFFKPDKDWH